MREDSQWRCRSALDPWVSFYFQQIEVLSAFVSPEREFSPTEKWLQGQIHTPYFVWRGPDRMPIFFCATVYCTAAKTKMIPGINLIGMVH